MELLSLALAIAVAAGFATWTLTRGADSDDASAAPQSPYDESAPDEWIDPEGVAICIEGVDVSDEAAAQMVANVRAALDEAKLDSRWQARSLEEASEPIHIGCPWRPMLLDPGIETHLQKGKGLLIEPVPTLEPVRPYEYSVFIVTDGLLLELLGIQERAVLTSERIVRFSADNLGFAAQSLYISESAVSDPAIVTKRITRMLLGAENPYD